MIFRETTQALPWSERGVGAEQGYRGLARMSRHSQRSRLTSLNFTPYSLTTFNRLCHAHRTWTQTLCFSSPAPTRCSMCSAHRHLVHVHVLYYLVDRNSGQICHSNPAQPAARDTLLTQ